MITYVKCNDEKAEKMAMQRNNLACQNCWIPIETGETSYSIRKNKIHPTIKRTQFPLMLSWAFTVHNAQRISLDNGLITLGRTRNMEKNFLVKKYNRAELKINLMSEKENVPLRKESQLQALTVTQIKENTNDI